MTRNAVKVRGQPQCIQASRIKPAPRVSSSSSDQFDRELICEKRVCCNCFLLPCLIGFVEVIVVAACWSMLSSCKDSEYCILIILVVVVRLGCCFPGIRALILKSETSPTNSTMTQTLLIIFLLQCRET